MNKLTEQELQEMTVVYGNHHHACRAAKELIEARAELATIKGEQEPFGYISSICVRDIHKGNSCPLYPDLDEDAGYIIPLFTHPAPLKE